MSSATTSAVQSSALPLSWLLTNLIAEGRVPPGTVALSVTGNAQSSTHSSEILILQTPDNCALRLLCKHAAPSDEALRAYTHRGGVSYEAEVYRSLLSHLPISAPRFYGAFHHATQNECYLVMEHLDDAHRVHKLDDPEAMPNAARWAGRLHALAEPRVTNLGLGSLHKYDRDYYLGWSRRTLRFSRIERMESGWLNRLCDRYEALVDRILSARQTIIHGEYYPKNVLMSNGVVYPVDWESAAVTAGEVDLASLIHAWPAEVISRCANAYCNARWDRSPPEHFLETLAAAQLYWLFRWLGDRSFWVKREGFRKLIAELHRFSEANSLL